jgi:iron complex outermembrane receptor protein
VRRRFAVLGALLAPQALNGQEAEAPPDTIAPIIVDVTRSERELERVPYAITVLDKTEIQLAERGASIEEALRAVPGVVAQNRTHFALGDRLMIRGVGGRAQFGVRGIEVLADGIPQTMADGQATLESLDLDSAGRIEVLRGPASSLFGNAAGGVLSYTTEDFWPAPVGAGPQLLVGSYGFVKANIKLSGSTGDFGYFLNGVMASSKGFREHAEADLYRLNGVASTRLSPSSELRFVGNFLDVPFAQNPGSLDSTTARDDPQSARAFNVAQGTGKEIRQGQAGIKWRQVVGRGQIDVSGWGLGRDVWNPIPARIIDLSRTGAGLRGNWVNSSDLGPLPLRSMLGIDLDLQRDDRREFSNEGVDEPGGRAQSGALQLNQRERVSSVGPFAEADLELSPEWRLTAGGRYDWFTFEVDDRFLSDGDDSGRRTFGHFSPMLGLQVSPEPWLNLYANFSTAFQTPTASELSNLPDGSGGLNPDLEPEDLSSLEAGARGTVPAARLGYEVTAYVARVENALVPFQGPTDETFFRNAGRVSRSGAEIRVDWLPLSGLSGTLALTFQNFRFDDFVVDSVDFAGNREPGIPERLLYANISYTAPIRLRIEADFRWVDAYYVNDANTATNWAWTTLDLRILLDRDVGGVRLQPYLGLDNIFDVRYNGAVIPNGFGERYFEPAPGRQVFAGMAVPLGPGAPAAF